MLDPIRRTSAADIAGAIVLAVANIDSPGTELNARAGVTNGAPVLVTQNVAGANEWTLYAFDATSSASVNSPYIVAALTSGQWIAVAGKYVNSPLNVTGAITSVSTVQGTRLISTIATGTAPLTVASTTNVANLNASSLGGATFAAPGAIGGGTPSTGAFTTISATGVITSTLATGTAPFTIASTTVVGNLNVSQLLGSTWAAPGSIGSGTPATGAFTTLSASGTSTLVAVNASGVVTVNANLRCYSNGSLRQDYGSGGGTGGAASSVESNANIVLWTSNYYYNGANDVRARAGGASRMTMDITTGASAGDFVFQCAANGAADSTIPFANVMTLKAASRMLIATTSDDGVSTLQVNGSMSINSATLIKTNTNFTNGAGASGGTLTNAPAVGNPTKWIPVNDNGTTRYIPAW